MTAVADLPVDVQASAAPTARQVALAELPEAASERNQLRAALIEQHLPMVRYFAGRYANRGEPMDDLLQAALLH